MAETTFFDDLDEQSEDSAIPSKPIWAMNLDDDANEKSILKWLNAEMAYLKEEEAERHRKLKRNLQLYKGIQYKSQEARDDIRSNTDEKKGTPGKIVTNYIYELIEQRVSRLVKFKPAVQVLPVHNELKDVIGAKSTKHLLDNIWYAEKFDGQLSVDFYKSAAICGEAFLKIEFDPDKGDLDEAYEAALEKAKKKQGDDSPGVRPRVNKIRLVDDNGQPMVDENGSPVYCENEIRIGDVSYSLVHSFELFPQRAKSWRDVNYVFEVHVSPLEELQLKYPDKVIKASKGVQFYDFEKMSEVELQREVVWFEFYHRNTKGLPAGRKIVFTEKSILENIDLPYSHGELPYERMSDIDLLNEVHGVPGIDNIKALTGTTNNLTNMILRNTILCGHPKWMGPAGSFKKESLANDITIVEYKGPIAPQLVQANPTPTQLFDLRKTMKEEAGEIYGVHGVSRGEPPAGVKAGIALQFLDEQENERSNALVLKANEFKRNVALKTISVCKDYYPKDQKRMMRVLGPDNAWQTEFFESIHLERPYDIRVQNASALPETKSARTQLVLDLSERFPDRFTADQVISMLDLAQTEKFVDDSTINVRHAEAENEMITDGRKGLEPEVYEDHLVHWKIHIREMQEWKFKHRASKSTKDRMREHLIVHEKYMFDQSKKNPAFAEALMQLPGYPVFYMPKEIAMRVNPPQPQVPPGMPPGGMPAAAGQIGLPPELPVNPELGGAPQLPANVNLPSMDQQSGPPTVVPGGEPGSVSPTRSI